MLVNLKRKFAETRLGRRIMGDHEENENGGILLLITVMCVMAVGIAATLSSSTIMASQVSSKQNKVATAKINNSSLEAFALSSAMRGTATMGSSTQAGLGSYKLFLSSSAEKPTSSTSPGVSAAPYNAVIAPATKWIVLEGTPEKGSKTTQVYSYQAPNQAGLKNALEWIGTVNMADSQVMAGPGVTNMGDTYLNAASLSILRSTLQGKVGIKNAGKVTINDSKVNGNIHSGPVDLLRTTVNGDLKLVSGGATNTGGVMGDTFTSAGTMTLTSPERLRNYNESFTSFTLNAADCANTAALKQKIESRSTPSMFSFTSGTCNPKLLANTDITLRTDVVLKFPVNTEMENVKFKSDGAQRFLTIESAGTLKMKNVDYAGNVAGTILASNDLTLDSSTVNGTIQSATDTARVLGMSKSSLNYYPVAKKFTAMCGSSLCGSAPVQPKPIITRVS